MRHRVRGRHLSRTSSHRLAMRRNMAASLFTHGRIVTTMPKAKEVRPFVEKLITLARKAVSRKETDRPAYVHYYRMILSRLQNKEAVQKLVGEGKWREEGCIARRYLNRNGGYTRILRLSGSRLGVLTGSKAGKIPELEYTIEGVERKLRMVGNRLGDNADRVIFELVEEKTAEPETAPRPEVPKEAPKKAGPGKTAPRQRKTGAKKKTEETKAGAADTGVTKTEPPEVKEAETPPAKAEEIEAEKKETGAKEAPQSSDRPSAAEGKEKTETREEEKE